MRETSPREQVSREMSSNQSGERGREEEKSIHQPKPTTPPEKKTEAKRNEESNTHKEPHYTQVLSLLPSFILLYPRAAFSSSSFSFTRVVHLSILSLSSLLYLPSSSSSPPPIFFFSSSSLSLRKGAWRGGGWVGGWVDEWIEKRGWVESRWTGGWVDGCGYIGRVGGWVGGWVGGLP